MSQFPYDSLPNSFSCSDLIKRFITPELLRWNGIQDHFGPTLQGSVIFNGPGGDKRWNDLHTRVNEHVSILYPPRYYPLTRSVAEHPRHFQILFPHHNPWTHLPALSPNVRNRRTPLPARRFGHGVGTHGSANWDCQL